MNSFLRAHFSYYPLTWMFYNRHLSKRMNSVPEKCRARAVYEDNISTYEQLLETDNSVKMHKKNLQLLATKLYKVKSGFSPDITKYGNKSLFYLARKIWELVPNDIKKVLPMPRVRFVVFYLLQIHQKQIECH